MNDATREYCWELVWELDIMRWAEKYKIYSLIQKNKTINGVLKLRVQEYEFIVTTENIEQDVGLEVTRLAFLDFLKRYDAVNYHIGFERNHQHMVGQLLDTLSYNLKISHKITSVGELTQTYLAEQNSVLPQLLEQHTKKHKK